MNNRERVLCALSGKMPDRVPFVDIGASSDVAVMLLSRDYRDLSSEVEVEKAFSRLIGRDNISSFDVGPPFMAVYREASDGRTHYVDGKIKTRDDLKKVELTDPSRDELYEKAAKYVLAKEEFAACAVIGMGCEAAVQSMGLEALCVALYDDSSLVEELLEIYTDWYMTACKKLCGLGFDFIWIADDIAYKSGPYFSPKVYREVFLSHLRKVADSITIPWIYHSDGNLLPVIDDLLSLHMNAVHPLEPGAMDIAQVKMVYGDRICVVGNVRVDTLVAGSPEDVEAEVKWLMNTVAPGGGYMISTSNTFARGCKAENVVAMGDAIRKYGAYSCRH